MSKNHNKICMILNYIEHLLVLASTVTGCVSISALASLDGIPVGFLSFTVGLEICPITARIKKWFKSIVMKKKKKHEKVVLLAKTKLNTIEVLIYITLTDSYFSHDEFVLINNMLKEIKNPKNLSFHQRF